MSVASILLKMAWDRLWVPGTPYYLPKVIIDGVTANGKHVGPMGQPTVPDLGPFALFKKDPWGNVSIEFSQGIVGGLETATNGGFDYIDETETLVATINFTGLEYRALYALTGGGMIGCALAGASSFLHAVPSTAADSQGIGDDSAQITADDLQESRITLSKSYQDQLVPESNGLDLVGSYYDNNWANNEIVRGVNAFSKNWPLVDTQGVAALTQLAAENPDDPMYKVGGEVYTDDSWYKGLLFLRACQKQAKLMSDTDSNKVRFLNAAAATQDFQFRVLQNGTEEQTVGQVMDGVKNAPAPSLASIQAQIESAPASEELIGGIPVSMHATPETAEMHRRAIIKADAAIAEWDASGETQKTYSELMAASDALGDGTCQAIFAVPTFVSDGKVTFTGSGGNLEATVTLTNIEANIPQIVVILGPLSGNQPTLYDEVVNALANSDFVKDLIAKKVNEIMSSQPVLTYLTDRINDSLSKALGSA